MSLEPYSQACSISQQLQRHAAIATIRFQPDRFDDARARHPQCRDMHTAQSMPHSVQYGLSPRCFLSLIWYRCAVNESQNRFCIFLRVPRKTRAIHRLLFVIHGEYEKRRSAALLLHYFSTSLIFSLGFGADGKWNRVTLRSQGRRLKQSLIEAD